MRHKESQNETESDRYGESQSENREVSHIETLLSHNENPSQIETIVPRALSQPPRDSLAHGSPNIACNSYERVTSRV